MMKINADFRLFASRQFDPLQYIPSPAYGVNRFMLDRIGDERARCTTIVQYQPHSTFPMHVHDGGEEFLVLQGTFHDEFGSFPTGSYVRNPIDSRHAPWVEEDGCTIFVKLLQMAEEKIEEQDGSGTASHSVAAATTTTTAPLHITVHRDSPNCQATRYGAILPLYDNKRTGEMVSMHWIDPDQVFPLTAHAWRGGEELLVVDGSLILSQQPDGRDVEPDLSPMTTTTTFDTWGWIRFPPSTTTTTSSSLEDDVVIPSYRWGPTPHPDHVESSIDHVKLQLRAGKHGAQLYQKTGHLTEVALHMEKVQIPLND